ncbi:MAG: protease Do [Myxococcales bacterium]|nr:protease Do [Myxococcales bacterium]
MAPKPAALASRVCPSCKVAGPARLLPGQSCALCETQKAWSELGNQGLVIDHAAIDEAVQRRRGEAAGEPLWKKLVVWFPPAITVGIAAFAAWFAVRLLSSREISSLDTLLSDLQGTAKRTTLVGLLALVVGIVALFRLRRQRQFRRLPFVISHAIAVMAGASALVIGAVHWYEFSGGFSGQYTSMPPREALGVTTHVDRILNATVVVLAPDGDGDATRLAMGTGAVVAADDHRAWIVTCSHVAMPYIAVGAPRHAKDAQPVWVQLSDGRQGRASVRWAAPPPLDVVVIELPIEHPPEPVTISADASAMQPSSSVTFVPNPYRSGWKVLNGELLRRETHRTSAGSYDLLFTSLPVTYGDSGSGLFDARGQLVGLNTWTRVGDGPSQGISLPSETMRALVDAIRNGKLDKLDDTIQTSTRE